MQNKTLYDCSLLCILQSVYLPKCSFICVHCSQDDANSQYKGLLYQPTAVAEISQKYKFSKSRECIKSLWIPEYPKALKKSLFWEDRKGDIHDSGCAESSRGGRMWKYIQAILEDFVTFMSEPRGMNCSPDKTLYWQDEYRVFLLRPGRVFPKNSRRIQDQKIYGSDSPY